MADTYFIRRNGKITGPHTLESVKAAAKAKKLTADDMIAPSKEGPWKKIKLPTGNGKSNSKGNQIAAIERFKIKKGWLGQYTVIYDCPSCSLNLTSDEKEIGDADSCPKCGHEFVLGQSVIDQIASDREQQDSPQEAQPTQSQDRNPSAESKESKLTVCEDCGGKVSKRAETCPHCGSPQRNSEDEGVEYAEGFEQDYLPPLPVSPHKQQRRKKENEQSQKDEPKAKTSGRKKSIDEYPLASPFQRLHAFFVAGLVYVVLMTPGIAYIIKGLDMEKVHRRIFLTDDVNQLISRGLSADEIHQIVDERYDFRLLIAVPFLVHIGILLVLAAIGFYFAVDIYLMVTRSQNIGKYYCKLQIIDDTTNTPVGFGKGYMLRFVLHSIIGYLPCIGGLYLVVDSFFIFSNEHRCLHDRLAGTHVIDIS